MGTEEEGSSSPSASAPTSPQRRHYTPSEIEHLGRTRPDKLKSTWTELAFCFSLLMSMFMAEFFVSGFNILLPPLSIALDIPASSETWPASVFSLVTGALLLPAGRLADMYGAYPVLVAGMAWFTIWSLVAGFSQNYVMLIVCRALQGIGPAAFLPSSIMILGSIYRPGPRKNLVFSLYGAFAPVGFFAGIFFAGLFAKFASWRWYFFLGAIFLAIITVTSYFTIPSDVQEAKLSKAKMDWWGTATVVPGLILVVFALTDGAHAPNGWATPYIPITLGIGCLFLAATVYVEGWVADQPLLPFDMFKVNGMKALLISLFFQYGVFGVFLFYSSFYIENVLHATPLQTAAWFTPMCIGGIILATVGGFIMHLLPGSILLLISGICYIIKMLLFAIMPEDPNYWAYIFPAMIAATAAVDITYNVTNVFMTTSMPKARQGLAGALINSILFLGISFFLGIADTAVSETKDRGTRGSYKVAFWFGVGCAAFALVLMFTCVRIGKASSELTVEEKEELERELAS